jgi:hypothetical protein
MQKRTARSRVGPKARPESTHGLSAAKANMPRPVSSATVPNPPRSMLNAWNQMGAIR